MVCCTNLSILEFLGQVWQNLSTDDISFISLNSYMCAEILVHSLIAIILKLMADNNPE